MAELLVRAKSHYLDKLSPEEVAKMTKEQLQSYNARSQIGDVIVVRPDGWEWGRCECLPEYIVVRTKETLEEAKKYEESLSEQTEIDGKVESKMLKVRKYNISLAEVSKKSLEVKDLEKLTPVELSVGETINMKVK
jgi:hypothetical protein